jgi:tetratricopeptide (TPR) repeat protein
MTALDIKQARVTGEPARRRRRALPLLIGCAALLIPVLTVPVLAQNGRSMQPPECRSSSAAARNPAYYVQLCFSEHQLQELKSAIDRQRLQASHDGLQTADALAALLGVRRGVIEHMFRRMGEEDVAPEDLADKLAAKVKRHKELVAHLRTLATEAGYAQQWSTILAEVEDGHYSNADHLIMALRDNPAADHQPVAAGFAAPDQQASIRAVLGQIELVTAAYAEAAEHFRAAAALEFENDQRRRGYAQAAANALYAQGMEKNDNEALRWAIRLYRQLIADTPRMERPDEWAALQDDLGNALLRLAAREKDAALFAETAGAFEAALQVRTKERDPKLWAATQWHLAMALFRQGLIESGTGLFEKSVTAYEAALTQIKRRDMPVEWGLIQNELGTVHLSCGAREEGRKHLDEAVAAFRRALEAGHPQRRPLDWGAKQNNLGTALAALADREQGFARINEAIQAFKASLAAYQEASAPFYIVGVKKNLARAEAMLENRKEKAGLREK